MTTSLQFHAKIIQGARVHGPGVRREPIGRRLVFCRFDGLNQAGQRFAFSLFPERVVVVDFIYGQERTRHGVRRVRLQVINQVVRRQIKMFEVIAEARVQVINLAGLPDLIEHLHQGRRVDQLRQGATPGKIRPPLLRIASGQIPMVRRLGERSGIH